MNIELDKMVKERCMNNIISQFILESIDYFKTRNMDYCSHLCDSITDLLLNKKNLVFTSVESGSFFSEKDSKINISGDKIIRSNYSTFIHEITHAIHYYLHSFKVPNDYEAARRRLVYDDNFMHKIRILMRYIIERKRLIIGKSIQNSPEQIIADAIAGLNEIIGVDVDHEQTDSTVKSDSNKLAFSKKCNDISKENNLIYDFVIIGNIANDLSAMVSLSEQLDRDFELLIDNIGIQYGQSDSGQLFYVLSHMEGMIDSLLLGKLHEGYGNRHFYFRGYGHSKHYFMMSARRSYTELIASFSVLVAYNDPILLELMKLIIGNKMYNILNTSLIEILNYKFTDIKKRK